MLPDPILPTPEDDIARILRGYERRLSHLERLEQGGLGLGARVFNSAAQTIANLAFVALTFDSERFDTDGIHSAAPNPERLTAQTAGIYDIWGGVQWVSNNVGVRDLLIHLNGATTIAYERTPASGESHGTISTIYELAQGDFVRFLVLQTSGGNLDTGVAGNSSPEFAMVKIG